MNDLDNKNFKILLVDDEPDIIEFLSYNLKKEGFDVYTATNGNEAIKKAIEINPHLILLDIMMPELDGIEVCEKIREFPALKNVLIAFLTARGEDYSQVAGFEAGADDYIVKPIKPKVLISRIKALLKRYDKDNKEEEKYENILKFGSIEIDKEKYIVKVNSREMVLPRKEFELLYLLASKPGKVFLREEIYSKIWGDDIIVGDRTIDVHIRKLREKIGENHIITIKGIGYKFVI